MRAGRWFGFVFAALPSFAVAAQAGEVRVAVAANFRAPADEIAAAFEAATGHDVIMSFGSTGQLFTQITQAAPFDVFLAADQARPARAVADDLAVADSRFTYAVGRLVLFSADPGLVGGATTLANGGFARVAIANPTTAPYGAAAVEALRALGAYERVAPKLVRGTNVAQAYQFVATGNAELGFVARSLVIGAEGGSRWIVPADLHAPIAQDAVLLTGGADNDAARAFIAFLRGPAARAVTQRYGYD